MPDWHSDEWTNCRFRLTARAKIRKLVPDRNDAGTYRYLRFLLAPETSFPLEFSEAAILELCDGGTTFRQMVEILSHFFEEKPTEPFTEGIATFLYDLIEKRLLHCEASPTTRPADHRARLDALWVEYSAPCPQLLPRDLTIPRGLLAEISYRCPLHCPYCSNPLELKAKDRELTTEEWSRAITDASKLGVVHVGFSGGEPLVRRDLPQLISAARNAALYTNLLTSGLGLTSRRAGELKQAGLDSVQISFQDTQEASANEIAGLNAHATKLEAIRIAKEFGFPLTLNIVLHRQNMDRIESIIGFAAEHGAERLELANVQFYGWALPNRDRLIPSREQVEQTAVVAQQAQEDFRGKMEIVYVLPDYFGTRPKACMQGWGRQHITINPTGEALPCPTAKGIPGLHFDNVREQSLREIWEQSAAFVRFRGTAWMPEPCRSCSVRVWRPEPDVQLGTVCLD